MIFANSQDGVAFLCVPLLGWGLWPAFRSRCGAPTPGFALLNLSTQFVTMLILCSTAGAAGPHGQFWHTHLWTADWSTVATWLGGFLVAHGDHIAAVAMRFIPPGVAFPLYTGTGLVLGSSLNYLQVGSPNTPVFLIGLFLMAVAVVFLSLGEGAKGVRDDELPIAAGVSLVEVGSSVEASTTAPPKELSRKVATLICFLAALFASCWSPLATYATKHGQHTPYARYFFFISGALCAMPSVLFLTASIEGKTVAQAAKEVRGLALKNIAWGVACGCGVSFGYFGYLLGSTVVNATVAFGITCCNALIAILVDIAFGDNFRGLALRPKLFFGLAVVFYVGCIGVLTSIS
mmetsp:Transcript_50833/g.115624  ORF Transcript_50833/g.115624 Transcript_50833/m.115624 type:complete len:348 (-) Transcript_50833:82-1125(-)